MPDRLRHIAARGAAAFAAAVIAAGVACAAPTDDLAELRGELAQFADAVAADADARQNVRDLVAGTSLGEILGAPAEGEMRLFEQDTVLPDTLTEMQRLDVRLAMAMLAQSFGAKDNRDVLEAQPDGRLDALVIRKGTATLEDLRLFLTHYGLQQTSTGETLVLKVPVIIWHGASLRLSQGDVVHLSGPDGAFVLNFGHIQLHGATVSAVGGANPRNADFTPFITSAGGGTADLRGARISGLGFGRTEKFAGFAVAQTGMMPVRQRTVIEASLFQDMRSLTLSNVDAAKVMDNRFEDMRGPALVLTGARNARVSGNLFAGDGPANAIQLLAGSDDAVVSGNAILGGKRAGIVVKQGSDKARVEANIVWNRKGGGITIATSHCGRVERNLVIDNDQKGIEVRTSQGSVVSGNWVIGNHSAALWVSAQESETETVLAGNMLSGNGAGLAAASGARIVLEGNDFREQFPRFLDGDLSRQSHHVAMDLTGEARMVLTASGLVEAQERRDVCARGGRS